MPLKIVFIIVIIISFIGCDKSNQQTIKNQSKTELPNQESWSATIELTVKGIPRAIVWSGYTARYNKRETYEFSDSIHVDFYNEFGLHQSELIADSGKVFDKTNDLEVWSNVVVISDSGISLETERLEWDNKRQKILTNESVIFYANADTLYGDYFESDPGLKNYEIGNPSGVSHRKSGNDK